MIEANNIIFDRGENSILNKVNLKINDGELTAVMGPNGAGKSTLLKVISGELIPRSGEVQINAKSLGEWEHMELARHRGVMPQKSSLTFDFTVLEVVLMGRTPHNSGWDSKDDIRMALESLEKVECLHLKDRLYPTLSSGEQQRVSFARVLAQLESNLEGKNLLLDEPVSSMDPEHQFKTLQLAKEKAQSGCAVFVVLHDLNLAAAFADKIAFLHQGSIKAFGGPETVLTPENIKEVFNIDTDVQNHQRAGHLLVTNVGFTS